jgi:hypothetical protein
MRTIICSAAVLILAACSGSDSTSTAPTPAEPAAKPAETAPAPTAAKAPASQPAKKPGKGTTPADREQVDEDGIVRRGDAVTTASVLSVKDCAAKAGELNGKNVTVSGTVEKVCVKKGCWFAIADEGESIRITMKDYGFFVPSTSVGKKATVMGQLEVKEMTEEEAKHLAEDGGKDPSKIKGPQKELRITSAGLELRPST